MKQKRKYKNSKKIDKNTKKLIVSVLIFILIIIIMEMIINHLEKRQNQLNNTNSSTYSSIQEILEKYGCTFIKEVESKDSNYYKDIYLKFQYNTFEENKSKQRYYENIMAAIDEFMNNSYRLIDKEKNILIEIKKYTNIDGDNQFIYSINGKDDYFKKEQSKLSLINYNEDQNTNIEENSIELQQLTKNNWKKDVINFGTRESTFNKYDIYFDEGIEVRTISQKVYNIIFTSKYTNSVVNGIIPGTNFEQIISKMGEPTYGQKDGFYIGYKNNDIYVFFTKDCISIYRNEKADMEEFESLLEKYIDRKIELKEFMNELTYIWDDYEEYVYDLSSIYINYPLKGIKINMYYDNSLGIYIYKNCNITEKISELIKNEKVTAKLEEDLVENTFFNWRMKLDEYRYISSLTINENEVFDSSLYYSTISDNCVLFTSKDNEKPNKELNEKVFQGFFINDNIYIYSIENKGIYSFNVLTNEKQTLITGKDTFKLKTYENEVLKYDDKELKIVVE